MSKMIIPPSFSIVKDKVMYRRKMVYKLCVKGLKQKEIAQKLGVSLSTIEKDFRSFRENDRSQEGFV